MARSTHIATCLDYGGQHKTLLISGGVGASGFIGRILDGLWLLDIESGRCAEVSELFGE